MCLTVSALDLPFTAFCKQSPASFSFPCNPLPCASHVSSFPLGNSSCFLPAGVAWGRTGSITASRMIMPKPLTSRQAWLPLQTQPSCRQRHLAAESPRHARLPVWRVSVTEGKTFFKKIFVGVELIYNVVLVSAVQQSESVIHIHIPTIARTWKQPKCPSAEEWIKMWCIYTMEKWVVFF